MGLIYAFVPVWTSRCENLDSYLSSYLIDEQYEQATEILH